jgi:superfamily II DNA/RNA helicase
MLDMGFMPAMEKMMNHETMSPKKDRQTLMFSATFPEEVQRLAGQFLTNYIFIAIGIVGGACADVTQNFYEVSKFKKRDKLQVSCVGSTTTTKICLNEFSMFCFKGNLGRSQTRSLWNTDLC